MPEYLSIHDLTRRSTTVDTIFVHFGTFQFTTSQGGRPVPPEYQLLGVDFQFTTSQGGRRKTTTFTVVGYVLSIHDLTRRSTGRVEEVSGEMSLSIHDLTRRSTGHSYRR